MKIFNYGSINIDHIYRVPHLVQPGETLASHAYQQLLGGKGANQSIALARAGTKVTHLGRYQATDEMVLQPLLEAGVNTKQLEAVEQPGGHAIIQVDDQGENAIILFPGANHSFKPNQLNTLLSTAQKGDWLLLQNECSCTAAMINTAVGKGLHVAFNPAPMDAEIADLPLDKLALLFVNQVEVLQLLGADPEQQPETGWLAEQLQQRLPDTAVIVTLGAQGARYFKAGEHHFIAATQVQAVDTTGAGDTFIGYYLHNMLMGESVTTCLHQASLASALCVQRAGASVSIPLTAEVAAFAGELVADA